MAFDLSPEETAAILPEGEPRTARVAPRDFRQPRRLSREAREGLRRRATLGLREAEARLYTWLRCALSVELTDVGEISADGLFDGLEDPFCVVSLSGEHGPGWIVWDNPRAKALVEVAFGDQVDDDEFQASADREPVALTPVECGIAVDMARELVGALGEALGAALEPGKVYQRLRDLRAAADDATDRDTRRIFLHVELTAPKIEGTLRVYLPGSVAGGAGSAAPAKAPARLPAHLDPVQVELSATLGSIDVPLGELLSLEIGDVVPLGLAEGSPARLHVEDHICGRAAWGAHDGHLALRIVELESIDEDA